MRNNANGVNATYRFNDEVLDGPIDKWWPCSANENQKSPRPVAPPLRRDLRPVPHAHGRGVYQSDRGTAMTGRKKKTP